MMKHLQRLIITISFLVISLNITAQFNVQTGQTPVQYVNNLVGQGISFSNVQFTGDVNAVGSFTGANANLGFNSGIILSSGPAVSAVQGQFGDPIVNGVQNIPELLPFVTNCTFAFPAIVNDGAILEFDFVPQSTPVTFRYVFASVEYPTYVCSQYNDAFGFFISGPGIAGQQNLAIVPGTNDPITISTINNGNVGGAGTITNNPCVLTNSQYFNTANPPGMTFNGYTVVMVAVADVIPCQTYRIRLMIGDGCDQGLDSAVFLEAGSFGSTPVTINAVTLNNDSTTFEGCAPATLEITKNQPDLLDQDVTVDLIIEGTATNGVDYDFIPSTLLIPAGQTTSTLVINAIEDGIDEPTETIVLIYPLACGEFDTITIFIRNKPPIVISPDPAPSICGGQGPVDISFSADGGVPPLAYQWADALGNGTSISVNPLVPTTYSVTVTDFCGSQSTANIFVAVGITPDPPEVTAVPDPICENESFSISANSDNPNADVIWQGPDGFAFIGDNVVINDASVVNGGLYQVFASNGGCDSDPVDVNVIVKPRPLINTINSNSPVCEGQNISLEAVVIPGNSIIEWTGPNNYTATGFAQLFPATSSVDQTGIYAATATLDGCDALSAEAVNVEVRVKPLAPEVVIPEVICSDFTLVMNTPEIADTYLWTGPGAYSANTQTAERPLMNPSHAGLYALSITRNGCTSDPSTGLVAVIDASFMPPVVSNAPICAGDSLRFSTSVSGFNTTYFWSGPNGFTSSVQNPIILNPVADLQSGDYSLYLDISGCITGTTTIPVLVKPIPLSDAGLDIQICNEETGQIGSAPIIGHTYNWFPAIGLNNATIANPTVMWGNFSGNVLDKPYILTTTLNGCSSNDTVLVQVNPKPLATFTAPNPQCFEGNSFDFMAEGIFSTEARFIWDFGIWATPDSSAEQNPSGVVFNSTGVQVVRLSINDRGCLSNVYQAPVNIYKMPVSNFIPDIHVGCEPAYVTFTNLSQDDDSELSYQWDFGNGQNSTLSEPSLIYRTEGKYTVTLTSTNKRGCKDVYEVPSAVIINPSPKAAFSLDPPMTVITEPNIEFIDLSTNATDCFYTIGDVDSVFQFNHIYTFRDTGTYLITQHLRNNFGCTDSASNFAIVDFGYKIYVPNAFTPNDDGLNDRFTIYGEDLRDFNMRIYNRWGQLLYTSYDLENGWDGTTRLESNTVPGGEYIYRINVKDKYGRDFTYNGTVNLVR